MNNTFLQSKHFDREAKKENNLIKTTPAADIELKNFLRFLNLAKNSTVLEVGCGTGRYTLGLLSHGYNVIGVDIAQEALNVLKNKYQENKKISWGKLEIAKSIPSKTSKLADASLCINFLHHLDDIGDTLQAMVDILKRKGVVVAFEPNPYCLLWYIYFLVRGIMKLEKGIVNCTTSKIKRHFLKVGLKDITIEHYGIFPTRLFNFIPQFNYFNAVKLANYPVIKQFSFHYLIKGYKL